MNQAHATVAALTALIACSPIVASRPTASLPAGFEDVDAAILAWIAAEARRLCRGFAVM
jgi:hypothetical protein